MHETAPMYEPVNADILIADRSGSMASIMGNTIKSLNSYLEELRDRPAPGLKFTLIRFDTISTDIVHRRVPIADVPPITAQDLQPRGATPLIDALCVAVNTAKLDYADHDRIIFVTMTDGAENSSREFTLGQLRDLIKERSTAGWDFVFLGASFDAYADARRFGLADAGTMSYDAGNVEASRAAYLYSARRAKDYFATGARRGFTDAEKREAGDKFIPREES
jgi:hypothetical protein